MTIDLTTLDAHEQPSDELKGIWKAYSRTEHSEFIEHPDIDDLEIPEKASEFEIAGKIPAERLRAAFQQLEGDSWESNQEVLDAPIYFHPLLPGTLIIELSG
jgi:hypothetical protein